MKLRQSLVETILVLGETILECLQYVLSFKQTFQAKIAPLWVLMKRTHNSSPGLSRDSSVESTNSSES
jgi:hypothetical protein